jgi:hypothetical protein
MFNGSKSFWIPNKRRYTFMEAMNNAFEAEAKYPSKSNIRKAKIYRFRNKHIQWRLGLAKDFLNRNISFATFVVALLGLIVTLWR